MIQGEVKKVLLKGITKYADILELAKEQVQIRITKATEDTELTYEICKQWQPQQKVTFLDIKDIKFDLLGYGDIANQFIGGVIELYAKQQECSQEQLSLFAFIKEELAIALFKDTKNIRLMTLNEFFEDMGIESN